MQEKVQTSPQTKNEAVLQKQLSQIMLTSAIKQLYLMDICLEMLPFFVAFENSETDDSSSYYSNLYHYAGNTPVKYTDPDGRVSISNQLLTEDPNGNRTGVKLTETRSLVIHWTGVPGQTAQQTRNFFSTAGTSAHYVIGQDGEIIRMIPDDEMAYHAGENPSAGLTYTDFANENYKRSNGVTNPNRFTIGIEVNPKDASGNYTKEARSSAVKLAAHVISENKIGGFFGILFGKTMVRHGDLTGKNCPKLYMDNDLKWMGFKISVAFEYLKIKLTGSDIDE